MFGQAPRGLKRIQELRDEIAILSGALAEVRAQHDTLRSVIEQFRKEKEVLVGELDALGKKIQSRTDENFRLKSEIGAQKIQLSEAEDFLNKISCEIVEISDCREKIVKDIAVLTGEHDSLLSDVEEKRTLSKKISDEIAALVGKKSVVVESIAEAEREWVSLQEKKDVVLGAIEIALHKFRTFEKRVARLSQKTGFRVKYDDPEKLLNNS